MGLQELQDDARLVRERISKLSASQIDVKAELTDNVLPLFEGMCEAIREGLEREMGEMAETVNDLGDDVDRILDQSDDVLQPETSGKIIAVVEVGKLLAAELEKATPKLNDTDRKRAKALIHAYRQGATAVSEIIAEITLVDAPEPVQVASAANGNAEIEDDDDGDDEDEDEIDDAIDGGEA